MKTKKVIRRKDGIKQRYIVGRTKVRSDGLFPKKYNVDGWTWTKDTMSLRGVVPKSEERTSASYTGTKKGEITIHSMVYLEKNGDVSWSAEQDDSFGAFETGEVKASDWSRMETLFEAFRKMSHIFDSFL